MEYLRLVEGEYVKIFRNWKTRTDLIGWGKLIKYDPKHEYSLPHRAGNRTGKLPYIDREIDNRDVYFPNLGQEYWYDGRLCEVVGNDKRADCVTMECGDDLVELQYPFDLEEYYSEGDYHVYDENNYLGVFNIVSDDGVLFSAGRQNQPTQILRRSTHRAEKVSIESRAVLYSGQRWVVQMTEPCFLGDLLKEDLIFYKDWGVVNVVDIDDDIVLMYKGDEHRVHKNPTDFYKMGTHRTHRTIPFYLTTNAAYTSIVKGYDEEE